MAVESFSAVVSVLSFAHATKKFEMLRMWPPGSGTRLPSLEFILMAALVQARLQTKATMIILLVNSLSYHLRQKKDISIHPMTYLLVHSTTLKHLVSKLGYTLLESLK